MLMEYLRQGLDVVKEEGLFGLIRKIGRLAFGNLFSFEELVMFELNLTDPINEIMSELLITIRLGSKHDINSFSKETYDYDEKGKFYSLDRMNKGDKCFLAVSQGRIVGYLWLMYGEMELDKNRLHIVLPNEKAFVYKGFVIDEFRGKRILYCIDQEIIKELRREGKTAMLTIVARDNRASIKARERIGFKEIGKIIQIRVCGFEYDFISKGDLLRIQTA